jgi:tetratricopeptide (TPR) repeat protein
MLTRAALAVVLILALVPGVSALRRNWAYLHLLHGQPAAASIEPGDPMLRLRGALQSGDWTTVRASLASNTRSGHVAALVVLDEIDRRVARGDRAGAIAGLGTIDADRTGDALVWYRAGAAYERLDVLDEAVRAYDRGASLDPAGELAEGRYRVAMIDLRQERWQALVDVLGPALHGASDDDLGKPIQPLQRGGSVWQGSLLSLGIGYEHLGRTTEAEAVYARAARLASPRRDWTLNRTLVNLARLQMARGDVLDAAGHLTRALDLASELEPPARREYELNTVGHIDDLLRLGQAQGLLPDLLRAAARAVEAHPEDGGAWYVSGRVQEASCDLGAARASYARSSTLMRQGAGAFLAGRPSATAESTCPH